MIQVRAKSIDMYGVALESTAFDRSGTEEVTISLAFGNAREESRQYNPGELGTILIEKVGAQQRG